MEIIPESLTSLWNKWELRVLVLLSLLCQVILITLGSRRKYIKGGAFISFIVWITYLLADWLAALSLGNLANNSGVVDISKSKIESKDQVLKALWAPFLLLHLGGPDTITAYALEDNNLWLRHLLGLLVQVTVAFYVFLWSWGNNALTFVAIPVFVSGIIKYSERTWVLRATSPDQFEASHSASPVADLEYDHVGPESECIHKGYFLFPLLKALYADQRPTFSEGQRSCSLMVKEGPPTKEDAINAFQLVEVQLGFLFDVLYTKAAIIYTTKGLILRLISVLSIVSALAGFIVATDNTYSRVDVVITYILFTGAVSLEIYAFVSLILSDWTKRWLTKSKSSSPHFVYRSISCCRSILCHEKRWSGYMAQQNLVDFCLKQTRLIGTNLFCKIYFELNMLRNRRWEKVDGDLKLFIFDQLQEKYRVYERNRFDGKVRRELLSYKGHNVKYGGVIGWSFEVDFDHSILLWHAATDICYYSDLPGHRNGKRTVSKMLSDYLFHILLMHPLMLPKWSYRITHVQDTFNQAIRLFHRRKFPVKDSADACKMLIQLCTQFQAVELFKKEKDGKSVLFDACHLGLQLQNNHKDELWDMICEVWIEMLAYAASQGEWRSHAQQLRSGGELLVHVALLMAELGLSEQIGTDRKKAPVDSQNEKWAWARTKLTSPC